MPSLESLANLWLRRRAASPQAVAAAFEAVAHLKPAVIITGASRGLGRALAERFAAQGHDVALVARTATPLNEAAAAIAAASGRTALGIPLDITQPDSARALENALARHGLYANVLVNNAGIGLSGPFVQHASEELGQLLALNVTAVSHLISHFLPPMLQRSTGGILNVSSLGGAVPGPGQAAYYASKAYVLSLTEALAAEHAGSGVRISALAPGPLNTRFHASMDAENSPYRILLPAVSLPRAARAAYWGFTLGRVLIVPGLLNRALYFALRLLPHPLSVPIVQTLLQRPRD